MAVKKLSVKEIESYLGIKAAERRKLMLDAPRCKCCNKTPYEIKEYLYNVEDMDAAQYVRENERFVETNKFYCTSCYIKVGMPLF